MAETFGVEEAVECIIRVDGSGEEQESDADIGFREQISKSEPNGIEKILQTTYINAACVLKHESQLWLAAIHRRLAGRRSVRHPYYAEFYRDIPVDLFTALSHSIKVSNDPKLGEPMCYIKGNSKGEVVSLTDIQSLIYLLTYIVVWQAARRGGLLFEKNAWGSTEKCLGDHKTKVLVSQENDFGLIYSYKKGQLTICFNYGEWNSFGFPQHNCNLNI